MTCAELEATLAELPLGTLEAAEREKLDAHAKECAACRAHADALRRAYGELRALGDDGTPLPAGLRQRLKDRAVEAVRATTERCRRCAEPVEPADATYFGLERHAFHVECLAKSREKRGDAPVRPALSCTFCHDRLERIGAAFCAACLAPHHGECFAEHGRCAAPGCEERRTVVPATAAPPRRRAAWPVVLLGGAAVLVGGAAAFREELRSTFGFADAAARQRVGSALRDGSSALGVKRYDEALASYEAALVVDPDNEEARRGVERCRQLLAGAATPVVAAVSPKTKAAPRELAPVIGKTRDEVIAILGRPAEVDQPAQGPTKLTYLKPTAAVFLTKEERAMHAVFYAGWSYRGVTVGSTEAEVRDALGVPDHDRTDYAGNHGFIYLRHGLVLVMDRPGGTVTRLVMLEDPEVRLVVGGTGWDPDRPCRASSVAPVTTGK